MKRNLWIGVVLVGLNAFVALLTLVWLPYGPTEMAGGRLSPPSCQRKCESLRSREPTQISSPVPKKAPPLTPTVQDVGHRLCHGPDLAGARGHVCRSRDSRAGET